MPELPILPFESQDAWEKWLQENHASSQGLWLKIAKKDSGHATVTYAEALDVALCFGWIDGQKNKFDDQFFLQKFTPRRSKSLWSKINREKVAALIEQGRMREPGMKEIERAKADGRWDAAYDSPRNMTIPEDFQAALDANPDAQEFYNTLNSANRYAILHRIITAKKPETRQNRIDSLLAMLKAKEKLH